MLRQAGYHFKFAYYQTKTQDEEAVPPTHRRPPMLHCTSQQNILLPAEAQLDCLLMSSLKQQICSVFNTQSSFTGQVKQNQEGVSEGGLRPGCWIQHLPGPHSGMHSCACNAVHTGQIEAQSLVRACHLA